MFKNEPVCMYKESWRVGLGQERSCLREGRRNCLKYLKKSGIEKRGGETKIKKRGVKLGEGLGAYIYIIRHLLSGVIFRFLPNLRRLNKIMKSVKSTNLKTN